MSPSSGQSGGEGPGSWIWRRRDTRNADLQAGRCVQSSLAAPSGLMADFANVWHAADKIVYSTTLHVVSTP